jgi:hypothetical protein
VLNLFLKGDFFNITIMGCDFNFVIEVLHHGKWIPIIYLGTKTSCGGFPLALATFDLYTKTLIKGDYHRNDKNMISKDEKVAEVIMGVARDTEKKRKGKKGKTAKKVQVNEEKPLLYYSKDHFERLLSEIKPLIYMEGMMRAVDPQLALLSSSLRPGDPDHGYGNYYKAIMQPIPGWMELAKSALPVDEDVWMESDPEKIRKTTEDLRLKRDELLKQFSTVLLGLECWPVNLPNKVMDHIAKFAVPVASDVRISWHDVEEQCKTLIEIRSPADLNKNTELGNNRSDCIIM